MYICKNLDGFCVVVKCISCRTQCIRISAKYHFIVSRSVSECNTTTYCSDID